MTNLHDTPVWCNDQQQSHPRQSTYNLFSETAVTPPPASATINSHGINSTSGYDRPCSRFSSWTSWDVPSASDSSAAARRFNRLPLPKCAAVNKSIRQLSHSLNSSVGTNWLTLTSDCVDEEKSDWTGGKNPRSARDTRASN